MGNNENRSGGIELRGVELTAWMSYNFLTLVSFLVSFLGFSELFWKPHRTAFLLCHLNWAQVVRVICTFKCSHLESGSKMFVIPRNMNI